MQTKLFLYCPFNLTVFLTFHQNTCNFLNILICRTTCVSNVLICVSVIKLPNNSASKTNQTHRGCESCNHRTMENAHARDSRDFSCAPQQDQIYLAIVVRVALKSLSDRDTSKETAHYPQLSIQALYLFLYQSLKSHTLFFLLCSSLLAVKEGNFVLSVREFSFLKEHCHYWKMKGTYLDLLGAPEHFGAFFPSAFDTAVPTASIVQGPSTNDIIHLNHARIAEVNHWPFSFYAI